MAKKNRRITCTCGRTFKTNDAIQSHLRNSSQHPGLNNTESQPRATGGDKQTAGDVSSGRQRVNNRQGSRQRIDQELVPDQNFETRARLETARTLYRPSAWELGTATPLTARNGNTNIAKPNKLYEILAIPGKGKGMVATTNIRRGTRVLSEAPILTLPQNWLYTKEKDELVRGEVQKLPKDLRDAFYDLPNIWEESTYSREVGICKTTVLPLGSNDSSRGVFLDACRINHSCRHNAQNIWNKKIKRLTVHALRDIAEGEEITITYSHSMEPYAERQSWLRETFKFDCTCELCSMPMDERKISDFRLTSINELDERIGGFYSNALHRERALRLVHDMLELIRREGIWNPCLSRAYNDAFNIARGQERERSKVFAERLYRVLRIIEGDDSPKTMSAKERVDELADVRIPEGRTDADFERWLWMLGN